MPRVKLTGLFLFITTLCIAMAAAATNTSHIRFKRSDRVVAAEQIEQAEPGAEAEGTAANPGELQFMSVPTIYPLFGLGMFGLMLWFVPGTDSTRGRSRKRSSSRRSKSRKSTWAIFPWKRSRR